MSKTPTLKLKMSGPKTATPKTPKIVLKSAKKPDEKAPSSSRKRKAEEDDDEDSHEPEQVTPKAKKTRTDWSGSVLKDNFEVAAASLKDVLTKLINVVKQATDKKGRALSTLFKALPSKSLYPDYYEFIENPICLNQIQGKIVSGKYISPGELRKDIVLLFSNAREYNVSGSQVFIDAEYMMDLFDAEYDRLRQDLAPKKTAPIAEEPKEKATIKLMPPKRQKEDVRKSIGDSMDVDKNDAEMEEAKKVQRKQPKVTVEKVVPPKDEDDIQLLFKSIEENNVKGVEKAIKNRVDPNFLYPTTVDGQSLSWTPLHAAAHYGRTKIVDVLVHNGASADMGDSLYQNRPLHWAVKAKNEGAAKRLIRTHHANRQPKNGKGQTPFELVTESHDLWRELLLPETVPKKEAVATPPTVKKPEDVKIDMSKVREPREKRSVREKPKEAEATPHENISASKSGGGGKAHGTPSGNESKQKEPAKLGTQMDVAKSEKKALTDAGQSFEGKAAFGPRLRPLPPVGHRPISPPPDAKSPHQLLWPVGKHGASRSSEVPSCILKDIVLHIPELDISLAMGTDFRSRAITIPYYAAVAHISVQSNSAPKGMTFSFTAKLNRHPLKLSSMGEDSSFDCSFDLVDGINAIEVTCAAFKGEGDDMALIPIGKEDRQKYVFIIEKK